MKTTKGHKWQYYSAIRIQHEDGSVTGPIGEEKTGEWWEYTLEKDEFIAGMHG